MPFFGPISFSADKLNGGKSFTLDAGQWQRFAEMLQKAIPNASQLTTYVGPSGGGVSAFGYTTPPPPLYQGQAASSTSPLTTAPPLQTGGIGMTNPESVTAALSGFAINSLPAVTPGNLYSNPVQALQGGGNVGPISEAASSDATGLVQEFLKTEGLVDKGGPIAIGPGGVPTYAGPAPIPPPAPAPAPAPAPIPTFEPAPMPGPSSDAGAPDAGSPDAGGPSGPSGPAGGPGGPGSGSSGDPGTGGEGPGGPGGGGGGECFPAHVLVKMADGTTRRIADIVPSDKVQAFDWHAGAIVGATVTETVRYHRPFHERLVTINNVLPITTPHRIAVGEDEWKEAGDLRVGDTIVTEKGTAPVVSIQSAASSRPVYNLHVPSTLNFFVTDGKNWTYLVHNGGK